MVDTDKQARLARIFAPDGCTVIAAMDHGLFGVSPLASLTHPGKLIEQVIQGGANAVLTTPGVALRFKPQLEKLGFILRMDGGGTALYHGIRKLSLINGIEDALEIGADAVVAMGFCGTEDEYNSLATLGRLAAACRKVGMPLMAEMLPLGHDNHPTLDQVVSAARIGADLGADMVKIRYIGRPEEYQAVIEACYVPVIILGGVASSEGQMLEEVRLAMQAGARGVAIGRNIWQSESPTTVTRAIADIVHPN